MKIRSTLELTEALDSALAWRKKELSALRILIATRGREHERAALRRAALPILYAHWEGFAKHAATCYLELVRHQGRSYEDLRENFVALAVRGRIRRARGSRRLSVHIPLVRFLLFEQDQQARFPIAGSIDTESNLSSSVLRDLLETLGLDYDPWVPRELLIDGSLLKTRNDIAHGERADVDAPTYEQLHSLVLEMLDQIRNCVENAAATRAYLRSSTGTTEKATAC